VLQTVIVIKRWMFSTIHDVLNRYNEWKILLYTTDGSNGNRIYLTTRLRVSYPVICIRLKWCTTMYHRNRVINANCSTYTSAKQTREERELLYWNNDLHNNPQQMFTLIDMTFWNIISRHEPCTQGSPLLCNLVGKLIFRRFV